MCSFGFFSPCHTCCFSDFWAEYFAFVFRVTEIVTGECWRIHHPPELNSVNLHYFPPKRRSRPKALHGTTSQKTTTICKCTCESLNALSVSITRVDIKPGSLYSVPSITRWQLSELLLCKQRWHQSMRYLKIFLLLSFEKYMLLKYSSV